MSYKYGRQFCCITRPSSCTLNVHNLNRGTWDMNWHHKRPFLIIAKCLPSLVESYGQYGRTHAGRFSQPVELINPQSVLELQSWSLWRMYVQLPSCIPGVPWLEDWANPALPCSLRGHCSKPSVDWWRTLPGYIFRYPLLMRGLKPGISDHGLSALGIPAPRKGLVPTWLTCFRSSAMQHLKLRWMLGDTSYTLGKFDENLDENGWTWMKMDEHLDENGWTFGWKLWCERISFFVFVMAANTCVTNQNNMPATTYLELLCHFEKSNNFKCFLEVPRQIAMNCKAHFQAV